MDAASPRTGKTAKREIFIKHIFAVVRETEREEAASREAASRRCGVSEEGVELLNA